MVRCVGRNVGCLAGPHNGFRATESDLDLAVENGKHLLEVVAVWRRAATRRDKHVYEAVATGGVLARQKDGVGVSRQSNVRQFLVLVRSRERQVSLKVIGRNGRGLGYHIYSGFLLGYWDIARATSNEKEMEPAGSGATWTGSPKGGFSGRKHHKPRQGVAANRARLYRDWAVGFIVWLDLFKCHLVDPFVNDIRHFVRPDFAAGASIDFASAFSVVISLRFVVRCAHLSQSKKGIHLSLNSGFT